VHDGAQAVDAVRVLQPDLLLLDVYLPDMSGIEALRRIRSNPGPQPDVVVITAAREAKTVRQAMTSGVVDYLVKPFSLTTFRDRLQVYRSLRAALRRSGEPAALEQSDVDRMLQARRPGRSAAGADLPKGLSSRTSTWWRARCAATPTQRCPPAKWPSGAASHGSAPGATSSTSSGLAGRPCSPVTAEQDVLRTATAGWVEGVRRPRPPAPGTAGAAHRPA
jgi:CheY-like chemotaxis protein